MKKTLWYIEAKALLLQPGILQQKSGEIALPSKFRDVKHRRAAHSPEQYQATNPVKSLVLILPDGFGLMFSVF